MAKKVEFEPGKLIRRFDFVKDLPKTKGRQVAREIATLLENEIVSNVLDGKSPVTGTKFPRLTKEYAKAKKGGDRTPDLQLTGQMLNGLRINTNDDNQVQIKILGKNAEKADGHNKLTGRQNNLPRRRFIPGSNQLFTESIMKQIRSIVDKAK